MLLSENADSDLLDVDQALSMMLEAIHPLSALDLPLMDAHGATLASNLLIDDEIILPAGKRIGPKEVGLAASFGLDHLPARPHPRVVVLSAGADLISPGSQAARGVLDSSDFPEDFSPEFESNSWMLTTLARDCGAKAFRVHSIAKDPQNLKLIIEDQLVRADLLIISGEVNDDSFSLITDVLMQIGEIRTFRIQPSQNGRFNYGQIGADKVPVLTLPGEPVISFTAALLFMKPMIEKMLNAKSHTNQIINLKANFNLDVAGLNEQSHFGGLIPVYIDSSGKIEVITATDDFAAFAKATHLLKLVSKTKQIKIGDTLELIELDR